MVLAYIPAVRDIGHPFLRAYLWLAMSLVALRVAVVPLLQILNEVEKCIVTK